MALHECSLPFRRLRGEQRLCAFYNSLQDSKIPCGYWETIPVAVGCNCPAWGSFGAKPGLSIPVDFIARFSHSSRFHLQKGTRAVPKLLRLLAFHRSPDYLTLTHTLTHKKTCCTCKRSARLLGNSGSTVASPTWQMSSSA